MGNMYIGLFARAVLDKGWKRSLGANIGKSKVVLKQLSSLAERRNNGRLLQGLHPTSSSVCDISREWIGICQCLSSASASSSTATVDSTNIGMKLHSKTDDNIGSSEENNNNEMDALPRYELETVFRNAELVNKMRGLLKGNPWDEQTRGALMELKPFYNPSLVSQVLRTDIPCETASLFFKWLKTECGFQHDCCTYGVMINVLGQVGRFDEIEELYKEMEWMTLVVFSSLMVWFGKGKKLKEALALWKRIEELEIKPTPMSFAAYIQCLVDNGRYQEVANTYIRMLREECTPNAQTLNIFIKFLIDNGELEAASKIFNIMKSVKATNSFTYELMAVGYCKEGHVDRMKRVLDDMKEYGYRLSARLTAALKALQSDASDDGLRSILPSQILLSEVLEDNEKNTVYWGGWRSEVCSNKGLDLNAFAYALHFWNDEKAEYLERQVDLEWSNAFVYEVLRRMRNADRAWSFFQWLNRRPGFEHDSHTCLLLMQKIFESKTSRYRKDRLLDDMLKVCTKPSVAMFNTMIKYYIQVESIDRASAIFSQIKAHGLDPNEASYSAMIVGYVRERKGGKVMELFEEMKRSGLKPDAYIYMELVKLHVVAGRHEQALAFFRKLQEGFKASGDDYGTIITMLNDVGNEEMAIALYDEMQAAGFNPTQRMYESLIRLLRKMGRTKEVKALEENRKLYTFFGGRKKAYQENLLTMLRIFCDNLPEKEKPPPSLNPDDEDIKDLPENLDNDVIEPEPDFDD